MFVVIELTYYLEKWRKAHIIQCYYIYYHLLGSWQQATVFQLF